MSKATVTARRYAKAIYELAKEQNIQEKVLAQLEAISKALTSDSEMKRILRTHMPEDQRVGVMAGLTKAISLDKNLENALGLMAERDRVSLLPEIYNEYLSFIDKDMGVIRGTVLSPNILTADQRKEVETKVNQITKKKAILSFKEDESVLGGFVVQVGSYKIDGSLKNQMNKMRNLFN